MSISTILCFRDTDGVAFEGTDDTMKAVIGPEVVTHWGIHHEIGRDADASLVFGAA